jgi:hypothetical protein
MVLRRPDGRSVRSGPFRLAPVGSDGQKFGQKFSARPRRTHNPAPTDS